jgi:heme-degrading monooxygenase HmoA
MIVRTWRSQATAASALAYADYFRTNLLPELHKIEGFRGAYLLRDDQDGKVEFLVLTKWASLEAIRAFAGDDVNRAVVEPEAVAVLTSFDATVRHYEVVAEDAISG